MCLKSWSIQDLQITVIRIQQDILGCNPVVHIHYLLVWEILLTNKQTNRQTKKFVHAEVRTLDPRVFSTMLLPTELWGGSNLITLIRLLLSVYYFPGSDWNPDPKIRPVVHEKQLSGSQIRISIRITPNFELGLPMIITSLLTKFHQNPTSRFWEILLTNKQTNRQTDTRRWLQYPAFRGIIRAFPGKESWVI